MSKLVMSSKEQIKKAIKASAEKCMKEGLLEQGELNDFRFLQIRTMVTMQ